MYRIWMIMLWLTIILVGCKSKEKSAENSGSDSRFVIPEIAVIKESFSTLRDESDNVDSPAVWHGKDGQHWVLATAKESDIIILYDAATGEKLNTFGKTGKALGELDRPNGIAIIDDYAIVVERDNHRIQVFSLPDLKPIGFFGEKELKLPYGLTVDFHDSKYQLFVTDNYEMPDESIPPADSLGHRVHHFSFSITNNQIEASHMNAFGATSGEGVLFKVESILMDREYNRLLIADEYEMQRNVKVYDLNGNFSGKTIPHQYFFYEPEGIVLWECQEDMSGYYVMTDQGKINNTFQVFDRKTLEYIGGFGGQITRNTDGLAITQKDFGPFKNGALYPVHDDGSLTAISWDDVAKALDTRKNCQ